MKKMIFGMIFSVLMFGGMVPAFAAGNATLSINPSSVSVESGERFDVTVKTNPNGSALNTVRVSLSFNPTFLRAEAVTLTQGAFDRSAPGNVIDNEKGKVYWGGFHLNGAVKEQTDVLKITFVALKDGEGKLKFSDDSKLIADGEEKISLKDSKGAVVTVKPLATETSTQILTVSSASHTSEDIWEKKNTVEMSWVESKSENPVVSYVHAFDESSNTDPKQFLASTELKKEWKDVKDGIHYFHLKAKRKDGSFTKTIHRRVLVDTTVPNKFELSTPVNKIIEGESLWLTFATTDDVSGVAEYQISMNDSAFQPQQMSPLEVKDLKTGTYFFRIAAIDLAGNTIYAARSVRVYPSGTDLGRPDGYSLSDETNVISDRTQNKNNETKNSKMILLITSVLVGLFAFGIIYVFKKRKK